MWWWLACVPEDSDPAPVVVPGLTAIAGEGGTLVSPRGTAAGPWTLLCDGDPCRSGTDIVANERWWVAPAAEVRLQIGEVLGDPTGPRAASVTLTLPDGPWDGETPITPTILVPEGAIGDGIWSLTDGTGWYDPDCGCLAVEPAVFRDGDRVAFALDVPSPRRVTLTAAVSVAADGPEGPIDAPIASGTADGIALGGRWIWGDLHGHSDLSADGCENRETSCAPTKDGAGWDLYERAAAADLGFVGNTEHAEFGFLYPRGLDGPAVDIWLEQRRIAEAAADLPVVPFVGYELTDRDDTPPAEEIWDGGHLSVIFRELDVCREDRYGSADAWLNYPKSGATYIADATRTVADVQELYAAFDHNAAFCGDLGILVFFHHGTRVRPAAVDWRNPKNKPDPRYTSLVEMNSEHGTFECLDLTATGCDFNTNPDEPYEPRGSVQAALSQGYMLGFTGGTDSHDARPGSLDDGPSWFGTPDGDMPIRQWTNGGITGLFAVGGDRASVFAGLQQRRTVASSGPRPSLLAWAIDNAGDPWLFGSEIPADRWPITISVRAADPGAIELIRADGEWLGAELGIKADFTVSAEEASPSVYLRLRLQDDLGADQRVWISPFFVGNP